MTVIICENRRNPRLFRTFDNMRFITADKIFPISAEPLSNSVLVVKDDGTISDLVALDQVEAGKLERLKGWIVPGFVNTHCHLELSYMKGKIPAGGGLHHFIKEVEQLKKPGDEEVQQAIKDADAEMQKHGIVAVGDICNTSNTFAFKERSRILYHNFIEVYAFDESRAENAFERGLKLQNELKIKVLSSITPHAPYSASKKLLKLFSEHANKNSSILTIHNQETFDEDVFFKEKKGSILDRLNFFGIDTSQWEAPGISSLHYVLPQLPTENNLLLVHNTFSSQEDISFANKYNKHLYWCFCPNANLYIENKLPNVHTFLDENCRITLGTDSYAGNWSLSILDEIKTLKKHFPKIRVEEFFKWATLNGAEFLRLDGIFGTLEKNKRPGLNLISEDLLTITPLF